LTLASIGARASRRPYRYDRHVSRPWAERRLLRLVIVPLVLLAALWGGAFALAKLHPAKPGLPKASGAPVELGDAYRGETVFQQTCAACHGAGGKGGGIGPRLIDNPISLAVAKAVLDSGRGAMPAGLVSGSTQRDVLAYLATIIRQPPPSNS
jgi:mono/diheme cytochrome c family protein